MAQYWFARVSLLKGCLAVAVISLISGIIFHSHLVSKVWGQEPYGMSAGIITTVAGGGVIPGSKMAVKPPATPAEVLMELAGTVSETAAVKRLIDYKAKNDAASRPRYYAVVDFDQPSTSKRFYVFDTVEHRVNSYLVSHGRGSEGANDDGIADVFSNQDGSNSSSLGIYRTLDEYNGKHGRSLRMEGLEVSNSNVLARGVVLHTADYVSDAFIRQTGRLGRSEGCFAVDKAVGNTLIDQLKGGVYIIATKRKQ